MTVSLDEQVDEFVDEATRLRGGAIIVDPHAPMTAILDALLDTRQRLDRVENLLAGCIHARFIHRIYLDQLRQDADEAWDEAAARARSAQAHGDYASAKERAASVNLLVLDVRRKERRANDIMTRHETAVEIVKIRMRGLADIRQDLLALIKAKQFESTLDR